MKENKFGIDIERSMDEYRHADNLDHIEIIGVELPYRITNNRNFPLY